MAIAPSLEQVSVYHGVKLSDGVTLYTFTFVYRKSWSRPVQFCNDSLS